MSWRSVVPMFFEMCQMIDAGVDERDLKIDLMAGFVKLFAYYDMAFDELEGINPSLDAALERSEEWVVRRMKNLGAPPDVDGSGLWEIVDEGLGKYVSLDPERARRLNEAAEKTGRSEADLVREGIDLVLLRSQGVHRTRPWPSFDSGDPGFATPQ